jgi:hypothetical protein
MCQEVREWKVRYTSEVGFRRYRWVWFTTIRVPLPHENQVVYQGIEMHWISPRLAFDIVDIRPMRTALRPSKC